ncbi:hypothetical protein PPYR_12353 [Photinus pyralis]|uniref:LRRCT domain-containing protein n=1 Tax=Photinus pyralis TaxID=7054 RepID=A0A5N4ADX1_PHOPY|nr:hypothetical protein PPYR_12353 [Photinus pyralis]
MYERVQGITSKIEINFRNTSIVIIREGAFLDLPQLYLYKNQLENYDQFWFYKTPVLQSINLGQNRLRKIRGGAFINLPSIEYLWLYDNEIEFVDKDAFKGLTNLSILQLSGNKLKCFDFNFYASSKLVAVSVNNNNITYISYETLDVIRRKLKILEVEDNPLQCACLDKRKCPKLGAAVCTFPKTKPSQCLERSDDDFQEGFWVSFARDEENLLKIEEFVN